MVKHLILFPRSTVGSGYVQWMVFGALRSALIKLNISLLFIRFISNLLIGDSQTFNTLVQFTFSRWHITYLLCAIYFIILYSYFLT